MKIKLVMLITGLVALTSQVIAQNPVTLDAAIQSALKNNISLRTVGFEVETQRSLKGTAFDLPKTNVMLLYGQYNSYAKNDNNITVTQTIPFTAFGSQGKYNRAALASSEIQLEVDRNELIYEVKQVYLELTYAKARRALLLQQDSIYQGFLKAATARYKSGETNLLEQATAETQASEVKNQLRQNAAVISTLQTKFKTLLNSDTPLDVNADFTELPAHAADSTLLANNPSLKFINQQVEVAAREKNLEAARLAPDLLMGAFSQTLTGVENTENGWLATGRERFTGFQVGLAVPLWFGPHKARIRSAQYHQRAAESDYASYRQTLSAQQQQALQHYEAARYSLDYYKSSALVNADLILTQSQAAFRGGEIHYAEYLMGLRNALSIKENYLSTLREYNQSIIYIEYLSGNP